MRKFGTEIEVYDYQFGVRTKDLGWKRVKEVSVFDTSFDKPTGRDFGFEFISPPLKGAGGLRLLNTFVERLNERKPIVNESCGLHIHVDASDYSLLHIRNVAAFLKYWDETLWSLVPSWRNGQFNEPIKFYSDINDQRAIDIQSFFKHVWYNGKIPNKNRKQVKERFQSVNLGSFLKYRTIEFRYPPVPLQENGLIDMKKIEAYIYLYVSIVEYCRNNGTRTPLIKTPQRLFNVLRLDKCHTETLLALHEIHNR